MVKVLWISNIPSPYKIELMNLLGKQVDLTCLFEYEKSDDRDDSWYGNEFKNFKYDFLGKDWFNKINKLKISNYDILINSDYSTVQCVYLALKFKLNRKPIMLQADGGIAIDRGFVMNKAISLVMKLSTCYLSSGKETDKYFNFYGVSKNIYHYRFTSLNEAEIIANKKMSEKKVEYKEKYNYKDKKIFLSIGQQIPRKGFDILIKAFSRIKDENVKLIIVGGKPQKELLEIIENKNVRNVEFIEFLEKSKLNELYVMSDYFVLATREDIWGLVINEAMSFGLPVISTDKCVAAVEFNKKYENCVIVPVEDDKLLSEKMIEILNDDNYAKILKDRSFKASIDYTIENTAKDYYEAILKGIHDE